VNAPGSRPWDPRRIRLRREQPHICRRLDLRYDSRRKSAAVL